MRRAKHESLTIDTGSTTLTGGMSVSYSGMEGSRCMLGDGIVTGLSATTLNIEGDCHVKSGMALALMIAIPKSEDHLYVVGVQVASSAWNTFEVDLQQVRGTTRAELRCLLENFQVKPSFSYQAA